jgi:excisionase family DNA binding protein
MMSSSRTSRLTRLLHRRRRGYLRLAMASDRERAASHAGPDDLSSHRPEALRAQSNLPGTPRHVLLTANEAAALLRTSRKAIYAMAERGQLPGVIRIGRRLLVRRDDVLSWLDERRAASPGGIRR